MKLRKIFLALLLTLGLVACSGQPSFHDANGNKISLSDYKGKWVFVNYWATWCHSCVHEIPELNAFNKSHQANAAVLGVNYDGLQPPQLNQAITKFSIQFPVLEENPQQKLNLANVDVVPTTFLIDPKGHVVKALLGPQTSKTLEAAIKQAEKHNATT